jgi:peptidyl-prolyl cis-trans isomerase A (cyclophilin A)
MIRQRIPIVCFAIACFLAPLAGRTQPADSVAQTTAAVAARPAAPAYDARQELADLAAGTYAVFETDHGIFVARLFVEKAPRTAGNFIGLAEGVREFRDPASAQRIKQPYYDNVIFHRVRRNGLIQTGSRSGGSGGTGYYFEDEFVEDLLHDKPGVLSMATQGPGTHTNDGQFAISLNARPELDMKYSVFGEIVKGLDVARAIGAVPTVAGRGETPAPPEPLIKTLRIYRLQADGSIVNSPPPPDVDLKMRWAPRRGDRGPSRAGNLAETTATQQNRGAGPRRGQRGRRGAADAQ